MSAKPVTCPYCREKAELVTGQYVYPHRFELWGKWFWKCAPCRAWVGCHPGTKKPLGRLANAELRRLKIQAHAAFDQIWQKRFWRKHAADPKYTKGMARGGRYKALAEALGITKDECHIGEFDEVLCRKTIELCKAERIEA